MILHTGQSLYDEYRIACDQTSHVLTTWHALSAREQAIWVQFATRLNATPHAAKLRELANGEDTTKFLNVLLEAERVRQDSRLPL